MAEQENKPEGEATEAPKALTLDDVNAAFTAREKRFSSSIQKQVTEAVAAAMAPIAEKLSPREEAPKEGEPEWKQKFSEMEKRLAASEKARAEEVRLREEERHTRLRGEERSALAEALQANGITDPSFLRAATALLYTEERRIARDEEGKIVFKIPKDGYDEPVDLKKGVAEWAKTDEGKRFTPPRQVGGAGTPPSFGSSKGKSSDGRMSKEEAVATLASALRG